MSFLEYKTTRVKLVPQYKVANVTCYMSSQQYIPSYKAKVWKIKVLTVFCLELYFLTCRNPSYGLWGDDSEVERFIVLS